MRNKRKKQRPQNGRKHKYAQLLDNVDYKDTGVLQTFISNYKKILPRRRFNLTAKQQRNLATAVKRGREMALLPYTNEQK